MQADATSPYVFPGERDEESGEERPQRDINRFWETVCKRSGIDGVRIHDVRHTAAAIMVSAGLSLPLIGSVLGHTQPQTTHRYAHLMDHAVRAAVDGLGAAVTGKGKGEVVELKKARQPAQG